MFYSYSLYQCIDPRKINLSHASQKDVFLHKTEQQLQNSILQKIILEFQSKIEKKNMF
jgi:hypothetical protein